jgi:hypothetical protein
MFRLVVIHQLVLSLIVGPMLCCCATARLGRDAKPDARATASTDHSHSRTCCGHGQKPSDGGRPKPTDPAKCPCKDSPAKTTTVPEATVSATDTLSFVSAGTPALDLPVLLDQRPGLSRPAARFNHRSACPSADDLLFAHHNLRC